MRFRIAIVAIASLLAAFAFTLTPSGPAHATSDFDRQFIMAIYPAFSWHNSGEDTKETVDSTHNDTVTFHQISSLPTGDYSLRSVPNGFCMFEDSNGYMVEGKTCNVNDPHGDQTWVLEGGPNRYTLQNYAYGGYAGVWDQPHNGSNIRIHAAASGYDTGWQLFGLSGSKVKLPTARK